jgi:hypothetical protein
MLFKLVDYNFHPDHPIHKKDESIRKVQSISRAAALHAVFLQFQTGKEFNSVSIQRNDSSIFG